jgi:hypothetical protein
MKVDGMSCSYTPHDRGDGDSSGPQKQMKMVRQQCPGMAEGVGEDIFEVGRKRLVILGIFKDGSPFVASGYTMMQRPRDIDS